MQLAVDETCLIRSLYPSTEFPNRVPSAKGDSKISHQRYIANTFDRKAAFFYSISSDLEKSVSQLQIGVIWMDKLSCSIIHQGVYTILQ